MGQVGSGRWMGRSVGSRVGNTRKGRFECGILDRHGVVLVRSRDVRVMFAGVIGSRPRSNVRPGVAVRIGVCPYRAPYPKYDPFEPVSRQ